MQERDVLRLLENIKMVVEYQGRSFNTLAV
jgi:hypothetical protein